MNTIMNFTTIHLRLNQIDVMEVAILLMNVCQKDYVQNPATCSCKNGKYLASVMDVSVIMCDEVIESYNEETNFNEKKAACKM